MGFVLINLLMRLFIFVFCFAFALAREDVTENSTIIIKNIGFESRDVAFDVSYCDGEGCKDREDYSYIVSDELKNNMEILAYKHLIDRTNKNIFVKMNGLRVMRGDEAISKYHKGIGLIEGKYDDYFSYKKMLFRYLDRVSKPIGDISMEYYGISPLMYNVYFPKIKGSIVITKTKANNNLYFYNIKMNVAVSPIVAVSGISGDGYIKDVVDVDKVLSLDFDVVDNKDGWNSIFDNLMRDISGDLSYALANMETSKGGIDRGYEKSAVVVDDDEDYVSPPVFMGDMDDDVSQDKSSHFFTLGVSAVPIKASLGLEYKFPDSYSHYFNSFSFGYRRNMIDWYDVSLSFNVDVGKKDYFIIDDKYAFEKPTLLVFNASLSKRMYFNSDIYIAPLLSGSISKVSSSGVKGFENNSYLQNYSISLGGEIGFNQGNHEASLWLKKSLKNSSEIVDGGNLYTVTVDGGVSFGVSYGYSF